MATYVRNPRNAATQRAIEIRKSLGAKENEECAVEFFFYTHETDDALDLVNELKNLHYEVECVSSSDDIKLLITGTTAKIKMTTEGLLTWSDQMAEIADRCNCEFDGWGSLLEDPDQEK